MDGRILDFPDAQIYIEPVLGDLIELQLDTVEGITYYAVVVHSQTIGCCVIQHVPLGGDSGGCFVMCHPRK